MSCLCCLLKAQCCQLERRGKITEIKSELFSHITNILWVKCFKQKYIFTVSLPVMPFGFRFASKICEAVRVSQISSGLQGFWVHRHSCDPSNLSTVILAGCFHQEEKEITALETIPFFFFFSTLVCLQRPYTSTQIPVSTNSKNRRQFSYVMFLAAASLPGPVQGELIGFLLHLCWGQTTNLSCWLFTAFHIWLCNVPGCILHIYVFPSKYIHKLLCMKSAHADPLCSHGSTPSHPYLHPMFWTVATTCQFTVGWMKLFLTLLLIKKGIWACEKQYLITVNLITNLYYYLF